MNRKKIKANPEMLFDFQIKTLTKKECPAEIIEELRRQKPNVLSRAAVLKERKELLPYKLSGHYIIATFVGDSFIPVIPFNRFSLKEQARMLRGLGVAQIKFPPVKKYLSTEDYAPEVKSVEQKELYDLCESPTDPYYLFDVSTSCAVEGIHLVPYNELEDVKKLGRSCLSAAELIAYAFHHLATRDSFMFEYHLFELFSVTRHRTQKHLNFCLSLVKRWERPDFQIEIGFSRYFDTRYGHAEHWLCPSCHSRS